MQSERSSSSATSARVSMSITRKSHPVRSSSRARFVPATARWAATSECIPCSTGVRDGVNRELRIWIADHLQRRLTVEDLAHRMSMSVRNFERVFTRDVGTTPSQYVFQMRVETARRQLERTGNGLKQVAAAAGFGSVPVMRRAFTRLLGITPLRYRELSERSARE